MALKATLNGEAYNALGEALKPLYEVDPATGNYTLKVDGAFLVSENPTALLNAKEHEKTRRQAAELELKQLKENIEMEKKQKAAEAQNAQLNQNIESGDIAAVTQQIQQQFSDQLAEVNRKLEESEKLRAEEREAAKQQMLSSKASEIANQITLPGYGDMLAPQILSQLQLNDAGQVVTTTGLTLEQLSNNFSNNPKLANIMVGSKASGASGTPTAEGGTPVGASKFSDKKWSELTSEQKVELKNTDKAQYDALRTKNE